MLILKCLNKMENQARFETASLASAKTYILIRNFTQNDFNWAAIQRSCTVISKSVS